ncbi:hypothetical protein CPB84DRAFT_1908916 [Gymnopilus junonius]|uniref:Uncharacterized protein n=1 Tax=Gymnopilus junonius TaxID=109634 RepID=A0A9P5NMK6_GYMJU|nr:hypothetical protein CPB84DRAFT_1908916 [Gymnopilus junonius]
MRRAQSVRHYPRPSLALAADDLGVLREGDESNEDVLRRQLLEKDRECDRLQMAVQALQDQLAQRPPIEQIQELQREYRNLELLLQGTQRENEKSMAETERVKAREKMLERELTRLAGDNWQVCESRNPSIFRPGPSSSSMHHRSNTISSPIALNFLATTPHLRPPVLAPPLGRGQRALIKPPRMSTTPTPYDQSSNSQQTSNDEEKMAQRQAALAQIEQVKMLILGMDQRLDAREEKLAKMLERAEGEGRRYENKVAEAKAAGVGVSF